MRIKFENEILDASVRKKIIEEIEGSENKSRKDRAYKRYQVYKDRTAEYVIENLLRQFDLDTVIEMRYAISNISICRKIIDKLARVYNSGADRKINNNDAATLNLQQLAKKIEIQSAMKKVNRFLKLQKNVALYVKPTPVYTAEGSVDHWCVKLEVLSPFLYDVVEDYYARENARVFILSSFKPTLLPSQALDVNGRVTTSGAIASPTSSNFGNNRDEVIADTPSDQGQGEEKTYIFWSDKYHFTCNARGEIIQDPENPENKNPFELCPIVSFALDQDGAFWAEGGDDLIDGSVLINSLISHINHVGVVQGYGQFYATGENLPRRFKMGPSKAIIAEYKKDEQAKPEFGFLNANPQLQSLTGLVEMYLALLLTSNNLSTSGVSTQLKGGVDAPSGVAMLIDKSESIEDVQDQRQIFNDREPCVFERVNKIINVYSDSIHDSLKSLSLPEDFKENFTLSFNDAPAIVSETEKLNNLKLRKEIGIDSTISLIMKDDPSLTKEQAEKKLKELLEDAIEEQMIRAQAQKEAGVEYADPNAPENEVDASTEGVINEGDKNNSDGE